MKVWVSLGWHDTRPFWKRVLRKRGPPPSDPLIQFDLASGEKTVWFRLDLLEILAKGSCEVDVPFATRQVKGYRILNPNEDLALFPTVRAGD
jgi:hypothetical protein